MTRLATALALALCLAFSATSRAEPPLNTNGSAYAIGGYDPVAYFEGGAAQKGAVAHAFSWHGATWLFASAEHRAKFSAAPERYAPAYGGWCAYAASLGKLAPIDPQAFTVYEGQLYLNYSLDVRAKWLKDRAKYIERADAKWPAIAGP